MDGGDFWQVLCDPSDLMAVRAALEKKSIRYESARLTKSPHMTVTCTGDDARKVLGLIEALEDYDDVQKVYANFEITAEELAAMG